MLEVKVKKHMSACRIPSKLQVSFPMTKKQSIFEVVCRPQAHGLLRNIKNDFGTRYMGQNSQRPQNGSLSNYQLLT